MENKLISKAYRLRVDDIASEPWHWDDIIVYADSPGEAKSKGIIEFDGAEVPDRGKYSGYREVTFTDIKATRLPKQDKYEYEGKIMTKEDIKQREWEKERDAKALKLSQDYPNCLAVVWAGCYNQYWGANRSGYTSYIEYAGKYTTKEAYDIVRSSDYSRKEEVVLLDTVKYNSDIDSKIDKISEQYNKDLDRLKKAKI